MGDVLAFGAPPRRSAPPPPSPAETRRLIEEAAQAALDTAEWLLAILDRLDGDPDCEDGGDTEPDLGAPDGHDNQVVWLRENDQVREAEAPETVLPVVTVEPVVPLPSPGAGRSTSWTRPASRCWRWWRGGEGDGLVEGDVIVQKSWRTGDGPIWKRRYEITPDELPYCSCRCHRGGTP